MSVCSPTPWHGLRSVACCMIIVAMIAFVVCGKLDSSLSYWGLAIAVTDIAWAILTMIRFIRCDDHAEHGTACEFHFSTGLLLFALLASFTISLVALCSVNLFPPRPRDPYYWVLALQTAGLLFVGWLAIGHHLAPTIPSAGGSSDNERPEGVTETA